MTHLFWNRGSTSFSLKVLSKPCNVYREKRQSVQFDADPLYNGIATRYTCLQKYLNTRQRDENTEMSCIFGNIFNFFYHSRGTPPSRPHHPPAATAAASPFLGVCISIRTLFPAAVTSLILQLHELYLHHWKAWSLSSWTYYIHFQRNCI